MALTSRSRRKLSAPEAFVGSFLGLIVAGTLALRWLPGLYTGEPLGWTDAAFTATSAVCVTGLIVEDTATYFTFEGQLLLLALIQLGGLGMLTLTSMVIAAIGGRLSLRSEAVASSAQEAVPNVPTRRLIFGIVRFTLLFEAAGALLLYVAWAPSMGWREAAWPAAFHSVSAFCNAGFSTNADSLMSFQRSPFTLGIVSLLIVAGGLGFVVVEELLGRYRDRSAGRRRRRLSTHTQLVLSVSAALLAGGWVLFAVFEWHGVLADLGVGHKLTNSLFMSVTARTAGFNTIDYAAATDSANLLTILLMMVGGSPGSTAGGMKTTTFALLGLLAWSRLRSQASVTVANRSVPEETVQRAVGLAVLATAVVMAGIFLLASFGDLLHKGDPFLGRAFEVVSAVNTVGLSMNVTPHLSPGARWLIIVLMFVGRVGPLSLAAALRARLARPGKYRLAHEDVVVG
ncbi:TrkH family potassium uptake protein [Alienimonas californiensis]|uniref:Ktr system potassium uptake protein B n=1 Tax=Alienimonas californiensis TaxID=2527989 RepID=A0A517PA37_9PLAN|nr:TrkH family potassium uptake protein [Alienimonas californiensis]QDT16246.1 Ktr system potassium uptake protein B [Alienimonas californiensis]